jgi:O-methyltransferase domain
METIGGNFFESVPTGADAYLLRWILHDWAEMEAAAILGSLRRAMKPTARLILVENVIPEGGRFTSASGPIWRCWSVSEDANEQKQSIGPCSQLQDSIYRKWLLQLRR